MKRPNVDLTLNPTLGVIIVDKDGTVLERFVVEAQRTVLEDTPYARKVAVNQLARDVRELVDQMFETRED